MKKGEKKSPVVMFNPLQGVTPDDKKWLRLVLTDPRFVRMLNKAQEMKPSSNC